MSKLLPAGASVALGWEQNWVHMPAKISEVTERLHSKEVHLGALPHQAHHSPNMGIVPDST